MKHIHGINTEVVGLISVTPRDSGTWTPNSSIIHKLHGGLWNRTCYERTEEETYNFTDVGRTGNRNQKRPRGRPRNRRLNHKEEPTGWRQTNLKLCFARYRKEGVVWNWPRPAQRNVWRERVACAVSDPEAQGRYQCETARRRNSVQQPQTLLHKHNLHTMDAAVTWR